METYGIITDKKENLGEASSFIDGKKIAIKWLSTHIGKVSVCNHFTFAIDTFENPEITKDNIHLYYEFMSDEEKINYSHTYLNLLFHERKRILEDIFSLGYLDIEKILTTTYYKTNETIHPDILDDGKCLAWGTCFGTLEVYYFGVKDTLKPIDEYIEEIKASSEYREYILVKGV